MTSRLVFAIDPSIKCTGYAAIRDDGVGDGQLVMKGTISPPVSRSIVDRCEFILAEIRSQIWSAIGHHSADRDFIVIETPQTVTRGKKGQRSASSLPTYGMIVGCLLWGLDERLWDMRHTVSATEWTKRGIPATYRDTYKELRVRMVESIYGVRRGGLGAKSVAGNVADAALIARWFVLKKRAEGP